MSKKVAIVGYSFRLPQTSRDNFWNDLVEGKNMISEIPADRWSFENHLHPDKKHPGTSYTFKAATLGDVSGFDADAPSATALEKGFWGIRSLRSCVEGLARD